MHFAGILVFFLLLMAELACPFCGTIVKGERGLSLHSSRYCKKNEIHFDNLLQQQREWLESVAGEEREQARLEAKQHAEREQRERAQDALCAQHLTEFQFLGVSDHIAYSGRSIDLKNSLINPI